MQNKEKIQVEFYGGNLMALIPMGLFILSCIIFLIVGQVYDMTALAMGAVVSLIVGCLFSKNWVKYWDGVVAGMLTPMISLLALIFLVIGMFSKLMAKGGIAEGLVYLGNKIGVEGSLYVVFTFIATCLISSATGTSLGTIFTGFPLFYPAGVLLGGDPIFLAGAILSGAIFGDNLAPISDTTIASSTTQEYKYISGVADVGGVVISRFKYCIIAAALACTGYLFFGGSGEKAVSSSLLSEFSDPRGLFMLIPVVTLLIIAFKKKNIFIAAVWGIIVGTITGLLSGVISMTDILFMENGMLTGFIMEGVQSMTSAIIFLYSIAGLIGIFTYSGLLDRFIDAMGRSKLAKTERGTEIIIAATTIVANIFMASNVSPAIVLISPISNRLGQAHDIHPYRRANLLDCFSFTLPVIIPGTSAFLIVVVSFIQGMVSEYPFIPNISLLDLSYSTLHCWALFAVMTFSVLTGWGITYEGKNGEQLKERPKTA
ncbi:MAG: Na+/H+ antiporter NhaC family protein [Clostridiaceae bacterium]|nr:Na+/H+ antiporter NhaC family protein [Clostridiaceae bacterium]